jgi:hypothetical protein
MGSIDAPGLLKFQQQATFREMYSMPVGAIARILSQNLSQPSRFFNRMHPALPGTLASK